MLTNILLGALLGTLVGLGLLAWIDYTKED